MEEDLVEYLVCLGCAMELHRLEIMGEDCSVEAAEIRLELKCALGCLSPERMNLYLELTDHIREAREVMNGGLANGGLANDGQGKP